MITKMEALEAIMETWNKYKEIDHWGFTSADIHVADEILNDIHRKLECTQLESGELPEDTDNVKNLIRSGR